MYLYKYTSFKSNVQHKRVVIFRQYYVLKKIKPQMTKSDYKTAIGICYIKCQGNQQSISTFLYLFIRCTYVSRKVFWNNVGLYVLRNK